MLTEERIRQLFHEFLPHNIGIMSQSIEEFIDHAKRHPYIRMQIQMGIYDDDNLAEDFLSPARAHSNLGLQVICVEIFNNLLDGIDPTVAENYVRAVAAHEAHHFHTDHPPVSAADHASSELACIQEIIGQHPELDEATRHVEANSPVYRRVFGRMGALERNLKKGKVAP